MANFDYPAGTPLGTVPSNYVLPSVDWQTNIQQVFKAPNFEDGSTHAPSAFVTVGGSGFELTGTGHSLAASARLNVESTAELRLKNGALLKADGSVGDIRLEVLSNVATLTAQSASVVNLDGTTAVKGDVAFKSTGPATLAFETGVTATWASGSTAVHASGSTTTFGGTTNVSSTGTVTFQNSSNLASGATAFAQWSGTWWFSGDCVFVGGTWPKLAGDRSWSRHSFDIALTTHNNGDTNGSPTDPDMWVETSNIGNTPMLRTRAAAGTGEYSIIEFRELPAGGEVTDIEVISIGVGMAVNAVPTYRFIRWQTGDANYEALSSVTTDVHTTGNFTSFNDTTTITPTATTTIDKSYRYGLLITHPYGTPSAYGFFYDVVISGTADSIQV